jgi:excisionase family DNA binding protein
MRKELETVLKLVSTLNVEQLPELLGELEQVRVTAKARLAAPIIMQPSVDRLLNVDEAAKKLGVSEDYLYRHHREFPFTRRAGRKLLFSSVGIEKHIRAAKIA